MSKISQVIYQQYFAYRTARFSPYDLERKEPPQETDWSPSEVKSLIDFVIRDIEGILADKYLEAQ